MSNDIPLQCCICAPCCPVCARAKWAAALYRLPRHTGTGYWEINIPIIPESSAEGRRFDAPFPDVDYGVGKRIQYLDCDELDLPKGIQ
jgi:hypothetical protein